jgi:hypothetical protein
VKRHASILLSYITSEFYWNWNEGKWRQPRIVRLFRGSDSVLEMPGVPETDGLASGATGITAKLREKMLLH